MPHYRKVTPKSKKALIRLLANGQTITSVCHTMRISRNTLALHRRNDPTFNAAVLGALTCQREVVEDALYTSAINGNVTAQIFYLINRSRNLPEDQKWRHVGSIDKLQVEVTTRKSANEMNDEELDAAVREVLKAKGIAGAKIDLVLRPGDVEADQVDPVTAVGTEPAPGEDGTPPEPTAFKASPPETSLPIITKDLGRAVQHG